ncbi:MAG TPA: hypothetical protein VFS42_07645 [Burkholderiaceae bacterium]|nr:hypothetical protein [Burkholderiaceae bacterium]
MSSLGPRRFSVVVVGFSPADRTVVASAFALSQRRTYQYVLHDDHPRRPDLYLADADDLLAIVKLDALKPTPTHPALLIGGESHGLSWPRVERPVRWLPLLEALDNMVEGGSGAREAYGERARSSWPFIDRRSRVRLDIDLNAAPE